VAVDGNKEAMKVVVREKVKASGGENINGSDDVWSSSSLETAASLLMMVRGW